MSCIEQQTYLPRLIDEKYIGGMHDISTVVSMRGY
jgi:hypothetical protein